MEKIKNIKSRNQKKIIKQLEVNNTKENSQKREKMRIKSLKSEKYADLWRIF